MADIHIDPAFALGLRAALAFVLITAAAHKVGHPEKFREVLAGYGLVPQAFIGAAPFTLTLIELTVGMGLLIFPMSFVAAESAGVLFFAYGMVMGMTIMRGRGGLDCGCGARNQPIGWVLVLRNLMLTLIALTAATPVTVFALPRLTYLTAAFVAAMAVLTYASADVLHANHANLSQKGARA